MSHMSPIPTITDLHTLILSAAHFIHQHLPPSTLHIITGIDGKDPSEPLKYAALVCKSSQNREQEQEQEQSDDQGSGSGEREAESGEGWKLVAEAESKTGEWEALGSLLAVLQGEVTEVLVGLEFLG